MKAIICNKLGTPDTLNYEEVTKPSPKKGEVLVKVKACGVNFPDTLIIQGKYQFQPPLPFSPGSDVAGIVEELGEGVKHLSVGQEVFGMVVYGGFSEYAVVPAASCFPMPPAMPFDVAASFMLAYGTSYHALKDRARIKEGDTLLVLGAAGGVGLAAVELGKLMGAKVIAAASTESKLEKCRQYGASETINYSKENLKHRVRELTEGKGVDVVYDPVGGEYTDAALRAMAWNGRYLVVGFAAGDIPKIPLNLPLLKGCEIVGVFLGAFATKHEPKKAQKNIMELMHLYAKGDLKPHIHERYPLKNAAQALQAISNREVIGKAVVVMD